MLDTVLDCLWAGTKFLYLYNMTKAKKQYIQKHLADRLQELKDNYTAEELAFSFMTRAEKFLVWAKENEEVSSIWERLLLIY